MARLRVSGALIAVPPPPPFALHRCIAGGGGNVNLVMVLAGMA